MFKTKMGEAVSKLVFRPPPPTKMKPSRFFYINIPNETYSSCSYISPASCGIPMVLYTQRHINDNPTPSEHKIPAFFIKRRGAKITFLYSHGNAEDLGMMYNRMKDMARVLGVNILAYDYTGYGLSIGPTSKPSESMCYKNIVAAYKYLRYDQNIPSSHIVLYGRSLGSGPSCYLAKKTAEQGESVAGLILHSPFLSIYRIVIDCGFNLVGDMFKNCNYVKKVICPVFVIHGTRDEVIPFWHGEALLELFPKSCRTKPFWVEGLGHNNIEIYVKKQYISRLLTFIQRYIPSNMVDMKTNNSIGNVVFPTSVSPSYKPVEVPEEEQYTPENFVQKESYSHNKIYNQQQNNNKMKKFFLNKTWINHGKDIIGEALKSDHRKFIRSNSSNNDQKIRKEVGSSSINKQNIRNILHTKMDPEENIHIPSDTFRFYVTREQVLHAEEEH